MDCETKAKLSNPFVLMYRVPIIWGRHFPVFAGLAIIGAILTAAGLWGCTWVAGQFHPPLRLVEAVNLIMIAGPLVLAHAGFLVVVSQVLGKELEPSIGRISFWDWLRASLGLSFFMSAILVPLLIWLPRMSVMALTAVLMLTPILPAMALRKRPAGLLFWVKFFFFSIPAALPWVIVIECLGLPSQVADSFGIMEGGVILLPLTALHTFLASTSSAVISTMVFLSLTRNPEAAAAAKEFAG
ncbi:MAG: hypothetical protein QM647_11525 [Asticcacaulis sp.]|uniref:hypothetical protein n=1 Tax=Asticcacaulis sp. TaxID=1872648 RepID=UPI0039E242C1